MHWIKKGLIFVADGRYDWMASHIQVPFAYKLNDQVIRVYFGTRDKYNRTVTSFMEVDADNPKHIIYIHEKPVLDLGDLGCFDDSGSMPSWIISKDDRIFLYYTGWNVINTVSYRLAISMDNGLTFERLSYGPIMDRSVFDPCWCAQPSIICDGDIWRMWYLSCTKWKIIAGHPEPFYHVKYAESKDGICWNRTGQVCIDYDDFTEAIGRPCVYFKDGKYKMLYSFRSATNYRTEPTKGYRLGYAESQDGLKWTRMDQQVGIDRSCEGWDSEMIEYCSKYEQGNTTYLFYNGNGFGKSGIGYAILDSD